MRTLQEVLAEKKALDAEIRRLKPQAIAQVKALMAELGVTLEDLGAPRGAPAKRPVKFRDGDNTWTGIGQRPRWLAARIREGHDLEEYRVR